MTTEPKDENTERYEDRRETQIAPYTLPLPDMTGEVSEKDREAITAYLVEKFDLQSSIEVAKQEGLAAWYDAEDVSAITLNDGDVSQWADKSDNHNLFAAEADARTTGAHENRREALAEILKTVEKDGLKGPRDLDVALDAIEALFNE